MVTLYLILMGLALLSSWFILWRVPLLKQETVNDKQLPSFSIIIPARNEEYNLPILLRSLEKQTLQPLEILVVDDDSDDLTAEVAHQFAGVKVLQLTEDEKEWVGKSAGCWYGAKQANGEVFIFLDADVFLPDEDSLEKLMGTFVKHGMKGALSIQPYHIIQKSYENLSAIFNIMVLAGMNHFSFLKKWLEPAGAFGPSLICTKETYFNVGGHQVVKDALMEHVALGKQFLEAGLPVHLYGGKNSLHFRMYPHGLGSLLEGWSKSFASGSQSTHPLILLGTSLWIAGAFVSFIAPFYFLAMNHALALIVSLIGYIFYFTRFYQMARYAGNFHLWALLLYPVLFIFFVGLFAWSLIQTHLLKEVSWKGRKLDV